VGQIYLLDNPLLREPLAPEHIMPRLLGHWGTTPRLNLIYAHLNRIIRHRDLNVIYITGPGHGGPGLVANAYLEGTYSEVHSGIEEHVDGLRKLLRQFSFPGGVPSHVAAETPGSIPEGGELGYALVHAYGAAFDNPDLVVACVIGDGEAETGPLAASWHSNKFLNPVTDGAVLPILHLNGYKIANRRCWPASRRRNSSRCSTGTATGRSPSPVTVISRPTCTSSWPPRSTRLGAIQQAARLDGETGRPLWPMIVLRTPKGWTGPKEVDGKGGGHLAVASGATVRDAHQPRTHGATRGVAAQLLARGAVRRARCASTATAGAGADRAAQDERQPARERRAAAARP
jgi:xylulose-5-phosphate/fructose-6-phosphate phosphoketolase